MAANIVLKIRVASVPVATPFHPSGRASEEYVSADGSQLLQLTEGSEIRFGPRTWGAAIHSGTGDLSLNFGPRRFLSYGGTEICTPWSPDSKSIVLVEVLDTNPAPGGRLCRLIIYELAARRSIAEWDFETLVSHRMWSLDGRFYLFRDVDTVYVYLAETARLVPVLNSKSPHFFLLENKYVCVIGLTGQVSVRDPISGKILASGDIPTEGFNVKRALVDEQQKKISVVLIRRNDKDLDEACYDVSVDSL